MRRSVATWSVLFLLACSPAWSGVVIQMEGSAEGGGADTIYAQGKMLRMDPAENGGVKMSMIFRDDTLWLIDHDKKECRTIDREGMKALSAQLGDAMNQMEAQLAQMPPEQREMVKKMMQGRMPEGMGEEAPPRRIEAGGSEQVGEYSCTLQTLYSGDEKVWEVCAAGGDLSAQAAEAMEAFRAMSGFTSDLRGIAKKGPLSGMLDTPFNDMNEVEGFPVRVRSYSGDRLISETTLKSMTREDLDASLFKAPEGYSVEDLSLTMKGGSR